MLDRKRKVFRSDNAGDFANYKSEEGEGQAEELLAQIQLNTEGLFQVEFWFWVLAETEEELSDETTRLTGLFKHSDGEVKIEDLGLSEAFLNFIPGVPPSFLRAKLTPSHYLLGLMPLSGDYLHKKGVRLHSREGKGVYFDNFSAANFNLSIIGHSGSGKTFLAQKIVDYHLGQGLKAVILDRGNSFDRLAHYHGGTIFGEKLNPLQFKNAKFLTEFFSSFIPERELSYQKKCLLLKTIRENLERIDDLDTLFHIVDKRNTRIFSLFRRTPRAIHWQRAKDFTISAMWIPENIPRVFCAPFLSILRNTLKTLGGKRYLFLKSAGIP